MRKRDAHDSWAKTEKLLPRASALDRASLATGEDGRGSDVLDNWLASLTNHEQRVVLLIVVVHLPVDFGATFTNGNKVGERDRLLSQ